MSTSSLGMTEFASFGLPSRLTTCEHGIRDRECYRELTWHTMCTSGMVVPANEVRLITRSLLRPAIFSHKCELFSRLRSRIDDAYHR